ncbi:glutathione S-transferase family protein [Terrihabitans rhizophilus]|uniref:Glutathione S-transferase family protein n=1 Tax=Terrihabitans rhizophilus TaxID=3092662 RepID=A0ABU4RQJ0_9HYPH|nr:glutathione S-transferase family protein [Terrihabitans sp. PJ23]MDX6806364.1 glutathione S-transferase family protein [Terrihabitans sp. PJ23]
MGQLVHGKWETTWYDTKKSGGRFVRESSRFRNWVTATGEPGPSGDGGFKAEAGRYHLYVSLACPWAHRALIFRKLKCLEDAISVSVVDPRMADEGWVFGDFPGATPDHLFGHRRLYEVYLEADRAYTGRVTVPVLWDRERGTIVSNESADIIRMMNSAFDALTDAREDYWPAPLREEIEEVNALVYERVNNGVYRAGFATTQEAYEEAATALFEALDMLEGRLGRTPFLIGNQSTEADWRLFTTLVRFDAVYHGHFKCNRRRIADYSNLSALLHRLYHTPGVAETVDLNHIKTHYYWSHTGINPTRIVPIGPDLKF